MGSDLAEKAEILPENQKGVVQNGMDVAARSEVPAVADGGAKAYIVALASFLVNGLLFGIINSYSVIYTVLLNRLTQKGIEGAEVKASLAGSLTIGTTFALSPVSGILTEFLGLRKTAVLGGIIATVSMLISSFTVDHIEAFCFTYGIMFGLGASFAYTPSLAILGHYFKRKLGIVNGVVTVGSCVFTVFITTFMEDIINNYGIEWMLRSLSLFTLGVVFCGLLFVPVPILAIEKPKCKDFKSVLKVIVNKPMWRIPRYRIWALSLPIALFGYFVPYVHIKKFIQDKFPGDINVNLPLQCIAVTSALGRISFGLLADRKGVNRIMLQQVSFYFIGMLTIILPFINMFALVVVISLGMGLFDGGFIALIGPIAFELVGTAHAAQAIGCMLGLAAIPLSIGPSIAGAIHSIYKNYTLPFVLAGISPLIGATVMFLVHWAKNTQAPQSNTNGRAITLNDRDIALAGSLAIGMLFALSPVSGILSEFFDLRKTAVLGGIIATVSMLISSFTVDHIGAFCFTYGIMFGLGASFAYTPSLAILGHYFKRKLGIVNGIVTTGSSVFTVFVPILMETMIQKCSIEWMLRLLCILTLGVVFCGLLFVPIPVLAKEKPKCHFKGVLKVIVNKPMWKIPRYRLWALSVPIALIGYFVPYIHIKKFIEEKKFPGDINVDLPLQCIAVTSALGRISFGLLADRKCVNKIMLQQVSFYGIGTLTIILPFMKKFGAVVAIALCMGLCDGGFIALMGPIAFELVGTAHAAQAIGCMLGLAAIPLSIGPSIAGAIYHIRNSYTLPFVLAGISPITGATVMFLIHWAKKTIPP